MTWVKWPWKNERWDECGTPWDHNAARSPLYNNRHSTTMHKWRLLHQNLAKISAW